MGVEPALYPLSSGGILRLWSNDASTGTHLPLGLRHSLDAPVSLAGKLNRYCGILAERQLSIGLAAAIFLDSEYEPRSDLAELTALSEEGLANGQAFE